jgi:hypothetical protein
MKTLLLAAFVFALASPPCFCQTKADVESIQEYAQDFFDIANDFDQLAKSMPAYPQEIAAPASAKDTTYLNAVQHLGDAARYRSTFCSWLSDELLLLSYVREKQDRDLASPIVVKTMNIELFQTDANLKSVDALVAIAKKSSIAAAVAAKGEQLKRNIDQLRNTLERLDESLGYKPLERRSNTSK